MGQTFDAGDFASCSINFVENSLIVHENVLTQQTETNTTQSILVSENQVNNRSDKDEFIIDLQKVYLK